MTDPIGDLFAYLNPAADPDDDRGPAVDPRHAPEPGTTGPACPHCGGGPPVPTELGTVCKSCARPVSPT